MIEITNITDDPFQRHIIIVDEAPVELTLRFYPRAQFWTLSTKYDGLHSKGLKMTLGTLHMRSRNRPFDFVIVGTAETGIDPFKIDDFSSGRCRLLMLEREDMESIRGQPVPI